MEVARVTSRTRPSVAACVLALLLSSLAHGERKDESRNPISAKFVGCNRQFRCTRGKSRGAIERHQVPSDQFSPDGFGSCYHFAGLSTAVEYQLRAEHDSVASKWKTLRLFNAKRVAVVNLKLKH